MPVLSRDVLGFERHRHLETGPGMRGGLDIGVLLAFLGSTRWAAAARSAADAARASAGPFSGSACAHAFDGIGGFLLGLFQLGLRRGDAIVVLDLVGELHRAARRQLGLLGQRNARRMIGRDVDRPARHFAIAVEGAQRHRLAQLVANFRYIARRLLLVGLDALAARGVSPDDLDGAGARCPCRCCG